MKVKPMKLFPSIKQLSAIACGLALAGVALSTAQAQPAPDRRSGDQRNAPPSRGPQAPAVWGLYSAAQVADRGHDYDAAHDLIEQALRRDPSDPELQRAAFRLRLLVGKLVPAADLVQRRQGAGIEPGLSNLVVGLAAARRGDWKQAESQLLLLNRDMDLGILRPYAAAWIKAGQRDFAGARAQLEASKPAEGDRSVAPHLTVSGLIDEMAGDRAEAERKLRQALELDPKGLRTTVVVAGFLRRVGKAPEAREVLRRFSDQNEDTVAMDALLASDTAPRAPTPADGIADLLFDLGGAIWSTYMAQEGAVPSERRPELLDNLGGMALMYMRIALDLRPDLDVARLLAAEILEQMDVPAKAIEMYQAIDAASPLQWRARLRAISLMADADRLEEALRLLRAMVNDRPQRYDAAAALGDLLRQKERYPEAIGAYDTAISRLKKPEPRHWPLYYTRGIAHERSKQWPKAEADFHKALELSPDQPHVLNYLGYSWIDQGINLEEGMKLLLKADRLKQNDGAITDSVGWAYYRLGQFDKAVEWLEKAIELKADDATIVEHLGDAYWQVGRRREARFEWERALRQKPEADRIEPLKQKLDNGLTPEKEAGKK